jgi:gamma-butyrobetaine hydroxylase
MQVSFTSESLQINWKDQSTSSFPLFWLRDNCPEDRDPMNGQRLVDITHSPIHPAIISATLIDDTLLICWQNENSKQSCFSLDWLKKQSHSVTQPAYVKWDSSDSNSFTKYSYAKVLDSEKLRYQFLKHLNDKGLAFLSDVPTIPGTILDVATLFGYVRETNYGKLFEVKSISNPNNLAYTDLALGLHTDNPYRNPVPGIQILHCLNASMRGGENNFVDGFSVAEWLRDHHPEAFEILATTPVHFSFKDASAELHAKWPLIHCDLDGNIIAIHYNDRSIASFSPHQKNLKEFYQAYRLFCETMKEKQFEILRKLENGDLVIFDNLRVLHGRQKVDTASNQDNAPRHLQGCYIDWDGVKSNLMLLEQKLSLSGIHDTTSVLS